MHMGHWRTSIATLLVVGAALGAFAGVTEGFSAITSDGVRRASMARAPRPLPNLALVDASGAHLSLRDYGLANAPVTFITLQYVRCQSVCLTSAAGQSWLQGEIQARGLEDKVRLLTLSFDPANDTPQVLATHAHRLAADMGFWRFATVRHVPDVAALLQFFGMVVVPDGLGGYNHNAALFLVDGTGRLSRAYDVDRPDIALADYLREQRPTP